MAKKLFHDDDCGEFLDQTGMCPKCRFHPDMQSTSFKEVPDADHTAGRHTMISIKGLNKASVLVALCNATQPLGLGRLQAGISPSEANASEKLAQSSNIDYFLGRPIKADLSGDEFDERLFDRDAGPGAAKNATTKLRASLKSESTPFSKALLDDDIG